MSDLTEAAIQTKAELLFPAHLISSLRDLREEEWQELVDRVSVLPETDPDSLAFVLMMIQLDGCMKCNSNNFKFLRGCFLCATQTIQSFKGSDKQLLKLFEKARIQIDKELKKGINKGQLKVKA